ncbi:hypothetical protein MARVELLAND_99 [Bacillus phage vB_BspM_MarvelLand]|nr:hypothetical protein MARVELLAND_99 [Bacillus phage vB_BspM_MarvelLand]
MHKIYTTINKNMFDGGISGIPYAGLDFKMAKERSNMRANATIEVWLEGIHIETYSRGELQEDSLGYEWEKTYDRKASLEQQIKKANMELDALTAAHILLQEEDKKCSTSLEKTAE